jgi:tetratricopeptide (TPR) repeat protein
MVGGTVHDRATLYLDAGRSAEAVALLTTHLASEPDDVRALCLNGRAFCAAGDPSAGVENARRAIAIDPDNEWAWRVLALALSANGDHAGARDAAARATRIAPDNWRAHLQAATVDVSAGLATFQTQMAAMRAVELAPNEPLAHLTMGNVALAKKYWTSAEEAYRRALALDPHLEAAKHNLALVTLHKGETGAAAAGFVDILATSPTSKLARRNVLASFSALIVRARVVVGFAILMVEFFSLCSQSEVRTDPTVAMVVFAADIVIVLGVGVALVYLMVQFVSGARRRLLQIVRAVRRFDPFQAAIALGLVVSYIVLAVAISAPVTQNSGSIALAFLLYSAVVALALIRRRRRNRSSSRD